MQVMIWRSLLSINKLWKFCLQTLGQQWDYYSSVPPYGALPVERVNSASYDFVGSGDKDILISGRAHPLVTYNLGFAGQCDAIDLVTGVPEFSNVTTNVFSSRPRNGSVGFLLADYDNDGDLDLYIPNGMYRQSASNPGHPHRLYEYDQSQGKFIDKTTTVFSGYSSLATLNGSWSDYDGDGYLDLLVGVAPGLATPTSHHPIDGLRLFHNVQMSGSPDPQDRVFVDVTSSVGLSSSDSGVLPLLWVDFDQDHDLDLVTIEWKGNSSESARSKLYLNEGGSFTNCTSAMFPAAETIKWRENMATHGDFDNDGDVDILYYSSVSRGYIENTFNEEPSGFKLESGWREVQPEGVQWETRPFDLDAFDSDLDGWLDFAFPGSSEQLQWHRLFENNGGTSFSEFTIDQSHSWAIQSVDWNGDGFTELVFGTKMGDEIYFRSSEAVNGTNTNNWAGVKLDSDLDVCNKYGIGATVVVSWENQSQARVVDGGSGNAGQHDLNLSFGLGSSTVESVAVRVVWPCGQTMLDSIPTGEYSTLF